MEYALVQNKLFLKLKICNKNYLIQHSINSVKDIKLNVKNELSFM